MKYRLFFDFDVFIELQALPKRTLIRLIQHFERLQISPTALSVNSTYDVAGRQLETTVCGQFTVRYWIDHADRDIKILEIRKSSGRTDFS